MRMMAFVSFSCPRQIFGGNRLVANYALAFYILAVGFYRDYAFGLAVTSQPKVLELSTPQVYWFGVLCIAVGQVYVLASFYQLGFLGTFLADYFGFLKVNTRRCPQNLFQKLTAPFFRVRKSILHEIISSSSSPLLILSLDEPCSGFPFSVYVSNPMYMGATLSFFGSALIGGSASGIVLTAWVYLVYRCALALEETFTNYIYAQRELERAKKTKKIASEASSSPKRGRSPRTRSKKRN